MVSTPSETGFRNTQQVKSKSFGQGGLLNDTGLTYKVKHVNNDFVEEFNQQFDLESSKLKQERLAANPVFLVELSQTLDQEIHAVIERFIASRK